MKTTISSQQLNKGQSIQSFCFISPRVCTKCWILKADEHRMLTVKNGMVKENMRHKHKTEEER